MSSKPKLTVICLWGMLLQLVTVCCDGTSGGSVENELSPQVDKSRPISFVNVSYEATLNLYSEIKPSFEQYWKVKTGETVHMLLSHGASGKQSRAVIAGLEADVISLALGYDVDAIASKTGAIPAEWQSRLPYNSCPYTSIIIFLVRKENPKGIEDWDDLARPDVTVLTPNPKTSGGARWNYLAAWGYALKKSNGNENFARGFVEQMYSRVPILDNTARAAALSFAKRNIGDVLIAWENEAYQVLEEFGADAFEVVVPSMSILAEPPVCLVDRVVDRRGTRNVAEAYLEYLYSRDAQEIIARNHFRPQIPEVFAEYSGEFGKTELFTIDEVFGGWSRANEIHFADGGMFDRIYHPVE